MRGRHNLIERITLSWKELQSSDMHFHWQLYHQNCWKWHLETVSFDRRNQQCGPASSLFGCLRAHCSLFISELFYFGNTKQGKRHTYSVREYTNWGVVLWNLKRLSRAQVKILNGVIPNTHVINHELKQQNWPSLVVLSQISLIKRRLKQSRALVVPHSDRVSENIHPRGRKP